MASETNLTDEELKYRGICLNKSWVRIISLTAGFSKAMFVKIKQILPIWSGLEVDMINDDRNSKMFALSSCSTVLYPDKSADRSIKNASTESCRWICS